MPKRGTNIKDPFNPNLSDSSDENFVLTPKGSRSRKTNNRSRSSKKTIKKRKRRSEDSDSLEEDSEDESIEELSYDDRLSDSSEEAEMDDTTGRPKRKAKAQVTTYVESEEAESEVEEPQQKKRKTEGKPSLIIKLPVTEEQAAEYTRKNMSRASSAARGRGPSTITKRNTRANTAEVDLEQLGANGKPKRASISTPEPQIQGIRSSRGAKSIKQPPPILEAMQEDAPDDGSDPVPNTQIILDSDDEAEEEDETEGQAGGEDVNADADVDMEDAQADADEEDEDDEPITSRTRQTRGKKHVVIGIDDDDEDDAEVSVATVTTKKKPNRKSQNRQEQGSDFEPDHDSGDDDDLSVSEPKEQDEDGDSGDSSGGRSRHARRGVRRLTKAHSELGESPEKEAAEELQELGRSRRPKEAAILYEKKKRATRSHQVNYLIPILPPLEADDEEQNENNGTPSRAARGRGGTGYKSGVQMFSTYGPLGGGGGHKPLFPGQWGDGDIDSSDDEGAQATHNAEGHVGLLPGPDQLNSNDSRAPANFGQVKSAKALADIDPLGVDKNIDFTKVGGLEGHIDQLKEMVQMPLLYPELFLKFGVTPPRGVLFHGPPGTGKTLLARALAATVGDGQQKISFYMRKGADTLSKWIGEAERQLGLLFEQARKTQPSIIFFDEIDGLAPVRSSKQDQTHSSIVATLLALMDGMDGRGQVIVIGATNRPDSVDPALRRPGRFDREFYFPLPDTSGRLSIINIHTSGWGINDEFKASLAGLTKGYGGADLRALCTEATLNAIQRTYPQIYSSDQKLLVDPDKVKVTAKDFMLSIKKVVPSSQRATSSGAAPLPTAVEPLLRNQFQSIKDLLANLIPIKKKVTALQEAQYEQYEDSDHGFRREILQQEFEIAQIFRPRLLIKGLEGMGQAYLGSAILHHFDGLHVQNFDLSTIYSDSTKNPEAAIVQLFAEAKRHKPSVIYLPNVDTWYKTVSPSVVTTFQGMLNSIPTTDPILVLGIADHEDPEEDLKKMFSFSKRNIFTVEKPSDTARKEFFYKIIEYLYLQPKDFPDPANRKRRDLEKLAAAPLPPPRVPTVEELKEQVKQDHQTLNQLKIRLQPIMDELKKKYKKFFSPAVSLSLIGYLLAENDPNIVNTDVSQGERAYELADDSEGNKGLRETGTGRFFYNLDLVTIEERLANGFYARAKDFLTDIRRMVHDNSQSGDRNVKLKAQQLLANVEIDIDVLERQPQLADCENVYHRQLQRAKAKEERRNKKAANKTALASPVRSAQGGGAAPVQSAVAGSFQALVMTPSSTPANSYPHATSSMDAQNPGSMQDTPMGGMNTQSQQIMGPPSQWNGFSNVSQNSISNTGAGARTVVPQTQAFQTVGLGQDLSQFYNDASPTTSGKRTSDSQRTSDSNWSKHGNPDSSFPYSDSQRPTSQGTNLDGNSQDFDGSLPATQPQDFVENNTQNSILNNRDPISQRGGSHLVQMTSFDSSNSDVLFNSPPSPDPADINRQLRSSGSSAPQSQQPILLDSEAAEQVLNTLMEGTRGCTVEMMEQIYRELMVLIWQERGNAQRVQVSAKLMSCFDEVISDMEEVRGLEKGALREEQ